MWAYTQAFGDNLYSRFHDSLSAQFGSEDQKDSHWGFFEELDLLILCPSVNMDCDVQAVFR